MKRLIPLLVICAVLGWAQAHAATVNAVSCGLTDIQNAVTTAAIGDTVHLPTCDTTWSGTVTINKRIILEGNGQANTIIRRSAVVPPGGTDFTQNRMFNITNVTGFEMRFMTLNGTGDTNFDTWQDVGVQCINTCVDFRFHHLTFEYFAIALYIVGNPTLQKGLVDHNIFQDIAWQYLGYGTYVVGDGSYPGSLPTLGTSLAVFVEDNVYNRNRHNIASTNGSRYVFRHNDIQTSRQNAQAIDCHGNDGHFTSGSRSWEVYENTVACPGCGYSLFAGFGTWGGDGVVWNNTFNNTPAPVRLASQVTDATCTAAYPMPQQIREAYIWNNTPNTVVIDPNCTSHIVLNRDYFTTARPGYTPYSYPHPLQGAAVIDFSLTATPRYTTSGGSVSIAWTESASTGATSCTASMILGTDAGWTGSKTTAGSSYTTAARTGKSTYQLSCTDGITPVVKSATVYLQAVANRVVSLPANEGSGTSTADNSGLENNALLTGVTWSTTAQSGGQALLYDAAGDYGTVPTIDLLPTAGSILFWARPTSFAAGNDHNMIGHTSTPPTVNDRLQLYTDATDGVLKLGLGNSHTVNTAVATLTANTWVHLALTWDTGTYRIHLNGNPTPTATGAYAGLTTIGPSLDLGNDGITHVSGFLGQIDDVLLYTVALTGAEIQALAGDLIPPAAPTNLRVVNP